MKTSSRWRRPRRRPGWSAGPWLLLAIIFCEGTGLAWVFEKHLIIAWLMAVPLGVFSAWLGLLALHFIVSWGAARYWPPVHTPPPPQTIPPPVVTSAYAIPPSIDYPFIAQARGQSGWVLLKLKVAGDGRIIRYQVTDQAPGRQFERAATDALFKARLPEDVDRLADCEMTSLISFVAPAKSSPDWARERLPAVSEE